MTEEQDKLLKEYNDYLTLKGYKIRGIEGKLRNAKYYLIYAQDNSLDIYSVGNRDAEAYRNYLSVLVNESGAPRYNPKTINVSITELRLFYAFLIAKGKSRRNPFLDVDRIKERFTLPKNILKIDQMRHFLENIDVKTKDDFKFKVLIELLYATGARISEVEGLSRKDINLKSGYLKIEDDKERQDRKVILTEYSLELLKMYIKYMWCNKDKRVFAHGKMRTLNRWINNRLKRIGKKLDLPKITCHSIRHTIATHLFLNGADIREVQEFLGHRRIKNTEVYTHIFPEDLKKVVEESHPREKRIKEEKDEA